MELLRPAVSSFCDPGSCALGIDLERERKGDKKKNKRKREEKRKRENREGRNRGWKRNECTPEALKSVNI